MKKLLFAVAVAAVTATSAQAQFGTPPVPAPPQAAPAANTANHYGWNPVIKRIMFWKKDDCGTGSYGKGGNCGPGAGANMGPVGGTLVFPTHPFARSPRDYFMYGHGGS
jgi:opacity protein-like surface antigen